MPNWASLPAEIRIIILELLTRCGRLAPYAAVSKEWQAIIEKRNFHRLKLEQSCLDEFKQRVQRQRGLVKHIWLNIKLRKYTCQCCRRPESETWTQMNDRIIMEAVLKLFSILSTWKPTKEGGLTLELNAYSPSDSEHWFKNCYFGTADKDDILESKDRQQDNTIKIDDPKHGWRNGKQFAVPDVGAIRRPYELVSLKFHEELPQVKAVTKFLLRRQCRRQWAPPTLWYLLSKLPRLEYIVYEPWQLWDKPTQHWLWDEDYREMIHAHLPKGLKKISVFEDFNEDYLALFQLQRGIDSYMNPDPIRITTPAVGAAFATRSLELEQLSVSFIADAQHCFMARLPQWRWNHLQSLILTSRLMTPISSRLEIIHLLQDAGEAALCMPKLQTMTLWNGAKREACAFTYRKEETSITWRGTWELKLEPCVLQIWKKVAYRYARHELRVEIQLLDCEIHSHGDAIHQLDLPSVIDPVSLWQIRRENP